MTLIQTFFSDNLVIQVSDRRLTRSNGSVFDDEYTKLVCWNHSFAVGFTGLARIDRSQQKSTSERIAEILSDYPVFGYGVNVLRTEVEAAIRKLPSNWDNRLAIVVAGFEGANGPLCAEITNFDTRTGVSTDPNTFSLNVLSALPGRETGAHSAGASLTNVQMNVLGRYLPRIIGQPDGVNRAIRIMVENQRLVAKSNNTVGSDAQCVIVPRQRTAPGMVMSNLGGPDLATGNSSFGLFEADGFRYKQIGPLMAHGGFVLDQFVGEADPQNPDNQSVSVRYVKVPPSWSRTNESKDRGDA